MTKNRASRTAPHGCLCGCGQPVYGNYAPGHDAKHVSRLVAYVVESWGNGYGGETGVRWERAIKQLPTLALQSKFRRSMTNRAQKHLTTAILEMLNDEWQGKMHLHHMIARVDESYDRTVSPEWLAIVAAAMGLTRHGVNYRRS